MDDIKIFLLDFHPVCGLGYELRKILEAHVMPSICVREENLKDSESDAFGIELSSIILQTNPDLIFLVFPANYLNQARRLIRDLKGNPVIAVLEGFTPEEMMELLRLGVSDYIVAPLKAVDVLPRVWRLLEERRSSEPITQLLKEKIGLKQLVGQSASFLSAAEKIPMIARCNVNVLISGETGTGKELFARAIHYLGPRADKPFIPLSCGAIPLELVENELFGHVPGAFTGANSYQHGLIHQANGGTLFLDEIDSLPPAGQVKFLRFLQEKEYKQLGSSIVHYAAVRVIAATNVDLEKTVKEGKFRQDLYYRLNIIPLTLPPLRNRERDIPLLGQYFIDKYSFEFNKRKKELSSEAIQKLMTYEWPGNVRELENVVQRAVIFSNEPVIQSADIHLPHEESAANAKSFREAKLKAVSQFEKTFIQDLLLANKGNISRSAIAAGKNRRAFWELMRKYKIEVESFK